MLSIEYFPALHVEMSATLSAAMRDLHDFSVANAHLLYDPDQDLGTRTVGLPAITTSTDGSDGTVWTFSTEVDGYDIVHLLNLLRATTDEWRDEDADMPAPTLHTDFTVKYYYGTGTVDGVQVASPDVDQGSYDDLSYSTGSDGGGSYVQFTVPSLEYWDMIVIEMDRS